MSSGFDLKDLQDSVLGLTVGGDISNSSYGINRENKTRSVRRIVDLYTTCRKNNRVYKHTYDALHDSNPFIRVAAADIIGEAGNSNSFDYLFKALEDEEAMNVRQKIVTAIDRLEARMAEEIPQDKVSLMSSMRILSYKS